MQAALRYLEHQVGDDDVAPQEMAQLWWALGRLRVARPSPALLARLREELRQQVPVMQPQELAMVLLGHAR